MIKLITPASTTNMNLGFKIAFLQGGTPLTRRWAFAPGENQRFAWVGARSLQQKPAAARIAEERPMDALEASEAAVGSQRQPRRRPRMPRKSQRQPRSSQEQLADSQEPPGSCQEQPGAARSSQGPPGLV